MSDVEQYQQALRAYKHAEKDAKDMIELIRDVESCFSRDKFGSFLGWHFGINDQIETGRQFHPKAQKDMDRWPDFDKMKFTFTAWHRTWRELHGAWNNLSADNRIGFEAPPKRIEARGY